MNARCGVLMLTFAMLAAGADGQVAAPARPGGRLGAPKFGPNFGVLGESYFRQSFAAFFPIDPVNNHYQDCPSGGCSPSWGRYATGSGFLVGPHPDIPGGALLTYLELDACDLDDFGYVRVQLYACDYLGVCGFDPLVDLNTSTTGSPGCAAVTADLSSLGYVVNNFYGELVPLVTTSRGDVTTTLLGVIYGYRLQVSPPPAAATFNDVPVGHPQFQFIEALASSGITAGCGGGSYCPDNPLTRGQMAVFLAKALGLYWAGF